MGIVHLKGSMLAQYLSGGLNDPDLRRHVESCEICKARLRDDRLLRVLLGPGGRRKRGHLDDEVLAAYIDQRLDSSRMGEIDRHLARCDRCLAACLELRRMTEAPATEPVPEHLRAAALDALATSVLGTLYLSYRAGRVRLFFMPEQDHVAPAAADLPPPGAGRFSKPPPRAAAVHEKRRSMSAAPGSAAPAGPAWARAPTSFDDDGDGEYGAPVEVPVDDDLALDITATREALSIRAIDPASGEPREGIRMRLEYAGRTVSDTVTDADGEVYGKAPPADVPARLILPGRPTRVIDIQAS